MDQIEKKWLVLYTRPRWEKKIDQALKDHSFKSFCPLLHVTRKWADRLKSVEIPLFPSYTFVLANNYDIAKIMQISGVLHVVKHCGNPVVITIQEIENIKSTIRTYTDIEVVSLQPYRLGEQIKVKDGLLSHHQGIVTAYNGRSVILTIENLGFALTVKIKPEHLSRVGEPLQNLRAYQQV